MLKIGSHVSMNSPEYFKGSVKEAISYNETTFMFYTGAPQNSFRTPIEQLKIDEGLALLKEAHIDIKDVVVHAPYLINLGNLNEEKVKFAYDTLDNEIKRTLKIGCKYLVLHPGASMDYNRDDSILQVAKLVNMAINNNPGIVILLETMSGKGSEIGIIFEELKFIISKIDNKEGIGICLDTCHIHDGGYDINYFDQVLDEFDRLIGLNYLYVIHVNDSKNERGAHKDRHENIGFGKIGFENILKVVYNPRLEGKIFILETPYIKENEKDKVSYPPYKEEIEMIINKKFNINLKQEIIAKNKSV